MALSEGDIVLCTVERIIGTNVFVKLENGAEGCIVFSEVAPGRIRNIRDYVVPKKKIACKVLRLSNGRIDLSLRRVTLKEQKELKEAYKLEKSYESLLRSMLGNEWESARKKMTESESLQDFIENSKTNPKELEKIIGKENAKKVIDIVTSQQKKKKTEIKKEFAMTSTESDGVHRIKNLLEGVKGFEIRYISGGKYTIKIESEDAKKADGEITNALLNLEKDAKKAGVEFSIIKK